MEELKNDMTKLGAHPKCCEDARNSEHFFRLLGKQLNMGERYAKYSGVFIRAVRKEKNLKSIYGQLFPQAAKYYDEQFSDCISKHKHTDQPTDGQLAAEENSASSRTCKRTHKDEPTGEQLAAEQINTNSDQCATTPMPGMRESPAHGLLLYTTQPLLGQWLIPSKRAKSAPPTEWIGNISRLP